MPPLVTVVIPCYNSEDFIEECVLSVLKQDYLQIEIIVIDDASTDNSVSNIAEYPVCISKNTINVGECKASARGFDMAGGKYICRLSSDDTFVNTDHISRQVREMERHNLDWCYNNVNLVGKTIDAAIKTQSSWFPVPSRYLPNFFYIFDNLLLKFYRVCYLISIRRNPVNSSAMMIRAETYRKMLSWDDGLKTYCDGLLVGKMLLYGLKVRSIHAIGAFYRIHSNQSTLKADSNLMLILMRERLNNEIRNGKHPAWMKTLVWYFYGD